MEPTTPRTTSTGLPPLLIHSHIFKNAGTSLDRLLAECFGSSWTSFDPSLPVYELDAKGLQKFLATRQAVRAVSSHLPLALLAMPNAVRMVMLRHPIDRARSVFQFLRRDTTQEDHAAARRSFGEYVTWALDTPGKGVAVRNYQTFHLSSAPLRRDNILLDCTRDDLAEAEAVLAELPAFGLVRRFAASCRLFETRYGAVVPDLRLYEVRENASSEEAGSESDAVAAARQELGETIFTRLCNANQFDLALYSRARMLFEHACSR
jgi:hypothetical protein